MISRRGLEVLTAALTGSFGAAILASSLGIGVGWTPRGVGSGAFPAIAGLLIVSGSLYNLARALPLRGPVAIDRARLARIAGIFLPAALFVAAIPLLGLHVAAAVYVFGAVAAHKRIAPWRALVVGAVTAAALYAIFDWGFSVDLPRGVLGGWLGF